MTIVCTYVCVCLVEQHRVHALVRTWPYKLVRGPRGKNLLVGSYWYSSLICVCIFLKSSLNTILTTYYRLLFPERRHPGSIWKKKKVELVAECQESNNLSSGSRPPELCEILNKALPVRRWPHISESQKKVLKELAEEEVEMGSL